MILTTPILFNQLEAYVQQPDAPLNNSKMADAPAAAAAAAPPPQAEYRAPQAQQAPMPQPQHHQQQHPARHQPMMNIPSLNGPHTLMFGRLDSDYHIQDRIVQIDGQQTLPTLVYNQMEQLVSIQLPLNLNEFIRVWRTILLKRVQDVYEREKSVRPEHYVRVARNISLPAPLADLCYSLGRFHSRYNGVIYDVVQPARAAAPPAWWNVDQDLIARWALTMGRFSHLYTMREFPSPVDFDNKPMILTSMRVNNRIKSVKAFTGESSMHDAYIRTVNDELFDNPAQIAYENCHLRIVEEIDWQTIQAQYVAGYVLGSNS